MPPTTRDDLSSSRTAPRDEPPRVLVAFATRGGSTQGVAERIAATLLANGVVADCVPAADAGDLEPYDAFVFGSPVYDQRWLPEVDELVSRASDALAGRPVWLFSVGTFGDRKRVIGPLVTREPRNIGASREAVGARGYRVFAGAIDRAQWPGPSRLFFHLLGGRLGDNRDWPDIEDWSREIAALVRGPARTAAS